jgi:phage terminase large subunit
VDLDEPVSLAMDIGFADATAIWFWQVIDGEVRFVDYFEQSGIDAEELLDILELKPYRWETWWLPHDAVARTFSSKKSVLDTFREHDAPARLVPRLDLKDGIDSARKSLRLFPVAFDEVTCGRGLEALKNYSRKFDPDRKVFSNNPLHDQWSHGADAFRYASLVINHETVQLSVERGRARRAAKATSSAPNLNTGHSGWTFSDAFADHERKLAARRAAGRERI